MRKLFITGAVCVGLVGCLSKSIIDVTMSIQDTVAGATEDVSREKPDPDDKPGHNCACDLSNDGRSPFFWCDADGNRDKNGTHACCDDCGKNCGRVMSETKRPPPPVPVPLPPECPFEEHCKGKEECVVGGGKCCSKCKQACF